MSTAAYFRQQAQRCHRLARGSDYVTALALQEMEAEYTAKANELAVQEAAENNPVKP